MSDEVPALRDDVVTARAEEMSGGTVSEVSYSRAVGAAVAHALKARAAPGAPLTPWVCIGPRNVGGRIVSMAQDPGNALTLYAGSAHGGLWRSTDGGDRWSHLGPPSFNVPVGALAIHPSRRNVVYAGTGSVAAHYASGDGLFRITMLADGSAVFDRLARGPLPGETPLSAVNGAAARYTRIEVDPGEPDRFWVASQTGLWRCVATGNPVVATWTRDFPPVAPAVVPAGTPALAANPVLSASAGFADFPPYATDLRIARDPRDATTMVDAAGRTVARYLILHLGVNAAGVFRGRYDRQADTVVWEAAPTVAPAVAPFPASFGRVLLALCRQQPSALFTVFEDANTQASQVFATTNDGNLWGGVGTIPATDNGQADYSMVLEVHPDDPRIVVCGTLNVALSTNGAQTFTSILEWPHYDLGDHSQHADQHVALFDVQDRRKLWIGNDGGIALARDVTRPDPAGPGFWRKRSHGIVAGQFQDVAVHPLPALGFMSGGGLQDNGSWVSYGGQTWYRCGWADGGAIALHAGNPRQFIATQNGGLNLTTVTASLGPGVDRVMRSPVLADLPLADQNMHVRIDWYPTFNSGLAQPFVGLLEQDPRPANAGNVLYASTSNVNGAGNLIAPVATQFTTPPAPAALGALPGMVPVAVVSSITQPLPLTEPGEAGSALAFGPVPAAAPFNVQGWIGTSGGRIFHAPNVRFPPAAATAWSDVARLPSVDGLRYAPMRFAVHPTNPALVAAAAVAADRSCRITISTAGAPGVARFRAQFLNNGIWGPQAAAVVTSAAPVRLARTRLFLAFTAPAYAVGDRWTVFPDGTITPNAPPLAAALQVTPSFNAPITVTVAPTAGAVGTARFTFQVAGLPVQPALVTSAAVELPGTGVVLGFSGGPFVAGDTFNVGVDDVVTPGVGAAGTVEVVARLLGRVFLSNDTGANWTDVSYPRTRAPAAFGADTDSLPPGPVTSLKFDVHAGGIDLYAGTLAGIYRATGLPAAAPVAPAVADLHWQPFNGSGAGALPLTLVNDIETLPGTRRLRVATFGRGVWDADLAGAPRHRLVIRQTLLEDGRTYPRPFPLPIPDDPRLPAGAVWLDHAHAFDIRVDSAPFAFFDDQVDGVEFDERMPVDDLVPMASQAVYVQLHNLGTEALRDVDVHLLYAPAGVAAPVPIGGAAPAAAMPAALPDPATLVAPPDFNPSGASPWRRVAAPVRVAQLAAYEPAVVRFDWRPPVALAAAPAACALVALCTAAADPLPALAAGTTLAAFIAQERRAALRVVPVRAKAQASLFVRDGVDDNARLGNVAFAGRSPDLIVVQAEPANPATAFADLLSTRPQDRVLLGGANHVYLRVHNRGPEPEDAELHLWALALDAQGAPNADASSWTRLTPAAAPFQTVNVPAGGQALAHVVWASPADPAPGSDFKTLALVAVIRSADDEDPLPDVSTIADVDGFWVFFGALFQSDNAALRVLRAVS